MSKFHSVSLAECCEIVSGATPSTSIDDYWDGDICWVTPKDLSDLDGHYISETPRKITQAGLRSCAASILPANSVLFSSRAPIGHVAVNSVPMATNQGFKSFIPKSGVTDHKFLFHWLKANRSFLESLGNGATFKEVSKAVVSRVEIPLPPLPEQRRIAAILDQADALRAKRREALAQLDRLTQSIFIEMFGDPISNSKNLPLTTLGDATTFENGDRSSNYPSGDDIQDSGVLFLSTKNIRGHRLDFSTTSYITEEKFRSLSRGKARRDDLLITLRGTLGSCCIFDCQYDTAFINAQMMIVRPKVGLRSEFLHALLTSRQFQELFSRIGQGAAVPQLTAAQLGQLPIPIPEIEEQASFVSKIQSAATLKRQQEAHLSWLDSLFASLQHRAFRGEL